MLNYIKKFMSLFQKSVENKYLANLDEEMAWSDLFCKKRAEALSIKAIIDWTDKEINQMVYEFYGLTEEEIKIIEEG